MKRAIKFLDRACWWLIAFAVSSWFIFIGRAAERWQSWKWMVGQ